MTQDNMVNNYRNAARRVLCKFFEQSEAYELENKAFMHCPRKYPIVIRRLCSKMSLYEAIQEYEPIEQVEEEIMVDGDITCPKCKSKKIHRVEKQTRSADESATVFCYCSECGKRWKF